MLFTSALVRGGWSASRSCCFAPVQLDWSLSGPQNQPGRYGEVKVLDVNSESNSSPFGRPTCSLSIKRLRHPNAPLLYRVTQYYLTVNKSALKYVRDSFIPYGNENPQRCSAVMQTGLQVEVWTLPLIRK
jgi:hypothetical protein